LKRQQCLTSLVFMKMSSIRFSACGGALSVLRAGPDDGPAVILIHGLGWDAQRLWHKQIAVLAEAGWQVIAPDMRGVGKSAMLNQPISIRDYADDIVGLMSEAQVGSAVLVGFSMGCLIAADLAARLGSQTGGLVLACGGLRSTTDGASATEQMLARAKVLGPKAFAAEQSAMVFGETYVIQNPKAVTAFAAWRAKMDQPSLHHAFRAGYGCDYEGVVAKLTCPISIIAADQDRFLPLDAAKVLARKLSDAPVHVIKDSGHMAPVEQPQAFNAALLDILSRVPS
jgi:pimeloyl-ACP methyl ester carboxylesterase